MSISVQSALAATVLPDVPYPGIDPYSYRDRNVFFGRDTEARDLIRLVVMYRGVLLFSESGSGKSSLINAGLIPLAIAEGYQPEKIRVQPKRGKEIVIERIAEKTIDSLHTRPSVFSFDENPERQILSVQEFLRILQVKAQDCRPLLIFDQFEEWITLFEESTTGETIDDIHKAQDDIRRAIVTLLRDTKLSVKLLISLREDYLARLTPLFQECPSLPDQYLRLTSPKVTEIANLIYQPFEQYPGRYAREITAALAQEVQEDFKKKSSSGAARLTEVQIVCQSLFESGVDTQRLPEFFEKQGRVQGVLINYLERSLHSLREELREPAVCLLGRMVTSAGTRNVIQEDDLLSRVEGEQSFSRELLKNALENLERRTRLVRREPRQNVYYYEITSEFLIGWIQTKFQEQQQRVEQKRREQQERLQRERQEQIERQQRAEAEAEALRLRAENAEVLANAEKSRLIAQKAEALAEAEKLRAMEQSRQLRRFRLLAWALAIVLLLAVTAAIFAFNRQQAAVRAQKMAEGASQQAKHERLVAENERKRADAQAYLAIDHATDAERARAAAEKAKAQAEKAKLEAILDKTRAEEVNRELAITARERNAALRDALNESDRAWHAQKESELLRSISFSRELAAAAVANMNIDTERSVLLALQALNKSVTGEGQDALHHALENLREERSLSGHSGIVTSVAFSPDGKLLASASADKTAKVWDAVSGALLRTLLGHADGIQRTVFSPDGKLLATASKDKSVIIWDLKTGMSVRTLSGHNDAVVSVAFGRDGKLLATASADGTAKLWNVGSGTPLRTFSGHQNALRGVAFSPDMNRLATAGADGTVKIWDTTSGSEIVTLKGHKSEVLDVAFSPDGKRLATASADNTAKVWEINSQKELFTILAHTDWVLSIAYSSDSTLMATSSYDGTTKVWDATTGSALYALSGHAAGVAQVTFSPNNQRLATASRDKTVRLWTAATAAGGELLTLSTQKGKVLSVAFSPNRKLVATTSDVGGTKIWDISSGQFIRKLEDPGEICLHVVFSPDSGRIATTCTDKTTKIWDVDSGRKVLTIPSDEIAVGVAFNPDGKLLATAGWDKIVRLWDTRSGSLLRTLSGHERPVRRIAFSSNGKQIVTASLDETVKLWDAASGILLKTLNGHTGAVEDISFSPDGNHLATASDDNTSKVWDLDSGKELMTLSGHAAMVYAVAFSPDGKRLATSSVDKTARIWDAYTGQELISLYGHTDAVRGVAFTSDGKYLFTASDDGAIREFALDIQDLIAIARKRVTRSLAPEECGKYLHTPTCPPAQ